MIKHWGGKNMKNLAVKSDYDRFGSMNDGKVSTELKTAYKESMIKRRKEVVKKELQSRKKKLDDRKELILNNAAESLRLYGEDDYRTRMQTNFINIVLLIESVVETLESSMIATDYIFEIINYIDSYMTIFDGSILRLNEVNQNLTSRWKIKRNCKQTAKILRLKIKNLCSNLSMIFEVPSILVSEFAKMNSTLSTSLKKSSSAFVKKNSKKKEDNQEDNKGLLLARERLAKLKKEEAENASSDISFNSPSDTSNQSSDNVTDTGIDNI